MLQAACATFDAENIRRACRTGNQHVLRKHLCNTGQCEYVKRVRALFYYWKIAKLIYRGVCVCVWTSLNIFEYLFAPQLITHLARCSGESSMFSRVIFAEWTRDGE